MKLNCAIFDFDGTLFDSMYIWDTASEDYLRSQGLTPKPSLREEVRPLSLYQTACYFQEVYGLSLSVAEILAGIRQTVAHFYTQEVQPKAGVKTFLAELRQAGLSLCVATATDRPLIQAALERCGMTAFFQAIFTCGEVGHGKDEPVIFRTAMEHFGGDRGSTIIFEDALHAVQTAKADGFSVAAVYDSSEERQTALRALADCYLPDYGHTEEFWRFASAQ